jgi:hypothetical protein
LCIVTKSYFFKKCWQWGHIRVKYICCIMGWYVKLPKLTPKVRDNLHWQVITLWCYRLLFNYIFFYWYSMKHPVECFIIVINMSK